MSTTTTKKTSRKAPAPATPNAIASTLTIVRRLLATIAAAEWKMPRFRWFAVAGVLVVCATVQNVSEAADARNAATLEAIRAVKTSPAPQAPVVVTVPTAAPTTTSTTTAPILEDDPRWDCATMGNRICGPTTTTTAAPGDVVVCWVERNSAAPEGFEKLCGSKAPSGSLVL